MTDHHAQVSAGQRFRFGENWSRFLSVLDEDRIQVAQQSIEEWFGPDLTGKRFLDIGSGSGLFSLAARRLGAQVHSFDFDPQSVACTRELQRRYFPDDPDWTVQAGSILEPDFVASLGTFDIVYSFGVLHHTGSMADALHQAQVPVAPEGLLFVSIYNDRGVRSRLWRGVKRTYCRGPAGKALVLGTFVPYYVTSGAAKDLLRLRNPAHRYREYRQRRGMSLVHDWVDWLGGYPFEVATPEQIADFYRARGFALVKQKVLGGDATNHFLFRRS